MSGAGWYGGVVWGEVVGNSVGSSYVVFVRCLFFVLVRGGLVSAPHCSRRSTLAPPCARRVLAHTSTARPFSLPHSHTYTRVRSCHMAPSTLSHAHACLVSIASRAWRCVRALAPCLVARHRASRGRAWMHGCALGRMAVVNLELKPLLDCRTSPAKGSREARVPTRSVAVVVCHVGHVAITAALLRQAAIATEVEAKAAQNGSSGIGLSIRITRLAVRDNFGCRKTGNKARVCAISGFHATRFNQAIRP